MINDTDFARVGKIIGEHNSFCICLPTVLSPDSVGAALALYIGLAKLGKEVTVTSESTWTGETPIIGAEKIQKEISLNGDNLVISFPYAAGEIDKVTSDVANGMLNINIYPQEGFKSPDPGSVKYRHKGGKVEAMIVLDAPSLKALGSLHSDNEALFSGVDIINIDRHFTNSSFGSVNIVDKQASSLSELIYHLLVKLNVSIDLDMATNLYNGLIFATKNFTAYTVGPSAFELAAALMKVGAKPRPVAGQFPSGSMPSMPRPRPMPQNFDLNALYGDPRVPQRPPVEPNNLPSTTAPSEFEPYEEVLDENVEPERPESVHSDAPPIEAVERRENQDNADEAKNILKPNIFKGRGGNLV